MQVRINDIEIEIPFDPEMIKLSDFLEWHNDYGKDLNKSLKEIADNKNIDETDRMIQFEDYLDREALLWFCFWTKCDFEDAKNQPNITPYLDQYRLLRTLLNDNDFEYPYSAEWEGFDWVIEDFKLNPASEMSFNEIITSKEVMRQVYKIGQDNWTGLPYLCCVFFRKKGELFEDSFIHEGSERMELFKSLSLKHALAVAFFLSICVNIWSNISVSSVRVEAEEVSLS